LALRGQVSLTPLLGTMASVLCVAYLSYALYSVLPGDFTNLSWIAGLVPEIPAFSGISKEPGQCSFVFSVQWVASLAYLIVLFGRYCPLSSTIKVASRRQRAAMPKIGFFGLKTLVLLIFILASIMGDVGVWHFPTLFNGEMVANREPLRFFVAIIRSPVYMPLFAWFSVFYTVLFYYLIFAMLVNWRVYFGEDRATQRRLPLG
jgi:hypothetical protein